MMLLLLTICSTLATTSMAQPVDSLTYGLDLYMGEKGQAKLRARINDNHTVAALDFLKKNGLPAEGFGQIHTMLRSAGGAR